MHVIFIIKLAARMLKKLQFTVRTTNPPAAIIYSH